MRMRPAGMLLGVLGGVFYGLTGCVAPADPSAIESDEAKADDARAGCFERGVVPELRASTSFRRIESQIASAFEPRHAANDVVTNPGRAFALSAKFAYGPLSKDLESEDVVGFLQIDPACDRWIDLGTQRTDHDGRVEFLVDESALPDPGVYEARFLVSGDGTDVTARIYALPTGSQIAVFDIDGTLTTSDLELVHGNRAALRPDADIVAWHYSARGVIPVYLTGRPYSLQAVTREWIARNGLPMGPVRMSDRIDSLFPHVVEPYKREYLQLLLDECELDILAAYGNATTDICAYARAGVPESQTFIVGPHGGESCAGFGPTQAIGSYSDHLRAL